jgi:hypothetical protein
MAMAIITFVQVFGQTTNNKTEQQAYELIQKNGPIEIRYYPPAIYASVDAQGNYRESSGNGFRQLADYIFGSNQGNQKIAMTAPVRMEDQSNGYTMSFVMPSELAMEKLPEPNNPDIEFSETEERYTASIAFGGWANDEKIDSYRKELFNYLNRKGIMYDPRFEYLGYNPPFQLTNRRNEIMVEIMEIPKPVNTDH